MAFADKLTASLVYTLIDETGSRGSFSLDVPQGTLAAVALAAAAALRPLIGAITGCSVVAYNLTYGAADDAPAAPLAGSRVERKGVFTFRTAAGKRVSYQLPGIISNVVKTSGQIDEDRPAVAAFVTALTAVDAVFCDSNGQDLRSLAAAYERYRSSTRAMLPSNRVPDADILPEIVDPTP